MKTDTMNEAIKQLTGIDTNKSIETKICAFCEQPVGDFRDKISEKEFQISGLCQSWQDGIFGE